MQAREVEGASPSRLTLLVAPESGRADFARSVLNGLTAAQKRIPPRFLYDARGSQLFEMITQLPEYYLTRSERSILKRYAREIVAGDESLEIVEFGSGSSCKTTILLTAAAETRVAVSYVPIDIAPDMLQSSATRLIREYPWLSVTAIAGEYEDALKVLPRRTSPRLFIFLGSNVGNFEPDEANAFLRAIAERMDGGDRLLVGIDLVKEEHVIVAAYNDDVGVTEAFNKNLLARINSELGGRFDPSLFEHHAPYLAEEHKIEMRLVSNVDQSVRVDALDREFSFAAGETIHTEDSRKFTLESFGELARGAGLRPESHWTDEREWFALVSLRAVA